MINASSLRHNQSCGDSKIEKGEVLSHDKSFLKELHPIPSYEKAIISPIEKSPQHINLNQTSFGFGAGAYHQPAPLFFAMPHKGGNPFNESFLTTPLENDFWINPHYNIAMNTPPFYFFMMNLPLLFFYGGI